jgi:hypothetical protein
MIEFLAFPKIPRMRRTVCVTEKIDGTNACIQIRPMSAFENGSPGPIAQDELIDAHGVNQGIYGMWAQSRQQFITPNKDNYGFATWVCANAKDLLALGEGAHYGEWWGYGIQRGYIQQRKRFSLFNVARWQPGRDTPPACCDVVPLLGYAEHDGIDALLDDLRVNGSKAAPGFMMPEGVIVWHTQSKQYYKILLENDAEPKGKKRRDDDDSYDPSAGYRNGT